MQVLRRAVIVGALVLASCGPSEPTKSDIAELVDEKSLEESLGGLVDISNFQVNYVRKVNEYSYLAGVSYDLLMARETKPGNGAMDRLLQMSVNMAVALQCNGLPRERPCTMQAELPVGLVDGEWSLTE